MQFINLIPLTAEVFMRLWPHGFRYQYLGEKYGKITVRSLERTDDGHYYYAVLSLGKDVRLVEPGKKKKSW